MAFLTARWSKLCLFNYAVEPDLLAGRLPPELSLDTLDGQAFVSLVAFDFLKTRVLGIPWPGFVNFPEINLRFYVKQADGTRGVMFIRELVPQWLVATIAKRLYNEPYEATHMRSAVTQDDKSVQVVHEWTWQGQAHSLQVQADGKPGLPEQDSQAHFFKEHQWGYGVDRRGRTLVYEVRHPHWLVYPVRSHSLEVDFAQLYGAEFAVLNGQSPASVFLAEGSEIEVFGARPFK
ncbi:MAG: hypothetical protein ACI9VR_003487 [Cognaticolwellia sp.]|jgi:uncharacterized protein YqjF (DUF2071 family)